jgi:DNA-binding beta-propeller fold protein YncE
VTYAAAIFPSGKGSVVRPRLGSRVILFLCLFLAALIIGIPESVAGSTVADRDEIERRLALPPFAYVAESDQDTAKIQAGLDGQTGAAAFIDSATDTLAARPVAGTNLNCVAVAPDGSRLYVTDYNEAVLHVLDAETKKEILKIALPGVEPRHPTWLTKAVQDQGYTFAFELMRPCSGGVACTPDGAWVLVCSSAGLQVVDTATNQVVRTLSDLRSDLVAVSFDGKRAYVACDTLDSLAPRTYLDWIRTIMTTEECSLVCLDLETWQIVNEIPTTTVAGIAVKPDDTQVFLSETYQKRVRVVDALTLADVWEVSTEPSYSVGIGFLPNGTKSYVVCFADSGYYDSAGQQTLPKAPKAEDFFCAVIDTQDKEIIKRIPLEAF